MLHTDGARISNDSVDIFVKMGQAKRNDAAGKKHVCSYAHAHNRRYVIIS